MASIGPIAFLNPWLLSAFILLPLAYFIIRAIPPAPRRLFFPATWLTRELDTQSANVEATPWWLIVLRLLMLALLILALAHPILSPKQRLAAEGPVIVLVDNDWSAAPDWPARQEALLALLDQLSAQNRQVALATTAAPLDGWPEEAQTAFSTADLASERIRAMQPSPWLPDYEAALTKLESLSSSDGVSTFYLTSGINHGAAAPFLSSLSALAPLDIAALGDAALRQIAFASAKPSGDGFDVLLLRPEGAPALSAALVVADASGVSLARQEARFAKEQTRLDVAITLPVQLRGRAARLSIDGARSAAARYVLDARSRRPMVGLLETPSATGNAPFQTPQFYLKRALEPYATLERGPLDKLMKNGPAVLLLPDQGPLPEDTERQITAWVEAGGLLIRFAGPDLLSGDGPPAGPLLPVALRSQARIIGGTLSWSSALSLAPFPDDSPFAGLALPEDVVVERQALARNGALSNSAIWATLSDGTPLVTTAGRGSGRIVLFHTTADPQWSNLAISGTFVEMLQRLLHLSGPGQPPSGNDAGGMLLAQILSGRGSLTSPPEALASKTYDRPFARPASADNPPGVYESQSARVAVNLASPAGPISPRTKLGPMQEAAGSLAIRDVGGVLDRSLRPALLAAVIALCLIDVLACLWLRGNISGPPRLPKKLMRAGAAALVGAALLHGMDRPALANPAELAANVRLACVQTGVQSVDSLCLNGLNGLVRQLNLRTSVWTGPAQLIDLAEDNLGLYPILYWPFQQTQAPLTERQAQNLNTYMQGGGMVVIDLGVGVDGLARMDTQIAPAQTLAQLRSKITLPPLDTMTKDHVLSHSFYILSRAPGRRGDSEVWLEAGGEEQGASVSPLILGNADWLTSWASVQTSLPGYSGGDGRRDELAVRFGVNLVMYALTGTYKADQVHLPALLERVGRGE